MPAIRRRPLLGAATAALLPAPAPAQGGEIRFGALFPFSGHLALLGDEGFRGLELAAEERNAAGGLLGRAIRLVRGDATDQAQAAAELRRLIGPERASAVFGTTASALAFAATQLAELQGVPYFELGATADTITDRDFRFVFRTCPRASDYAAMTAAAIAELLAPVLGAEPPALRIAILHEDGLDGQTIGTAQEAQLRGRGLTVLERLAYPARGADIAASVLRLRSIGAEIVLHSGTQNDITPLFRAFQEASWRPRMVIGAGAGYSLTDTARALGAAFEGVMNVDVTAFAVNDRLAPGAAPFAELYRRRYGSDPRSGHSLASYTGARICLDAVQRAGAADKDRIRTAVLATDIAEGATANGWGVRFDERGQNLRARPFVAQWQGGRLVTVFPAEAAVAPLRPALGSG